jgi:hypothetical protein
VIARRRNRPVHSPLARIDNGRAMSLLGNAERRAGLIPTTGPVAQATLGLRGGM